MQWLKQWVDRLRQWLCALFVCPSRTTDDPLLGHFILQLRDTFFYAQHPTGEPAVVNPAIAARIETLFNPPPPGPGAQPEPLSWETAYELERLLVYLRPKTSVMIEVDRRVAEAEGLKIAEAGKYRAQFKAAIDAVATAAAASAIATAALTAAPDANRVQLKATADQALKQLKVVKSEAEISCRAILTTVLDDLQWLYQKRILIRRKLWASASNLLRFGMVAMVVVGFPFIAFLFERVTGRQHFSQFLQGFPNYGLYTAVSFGLLGAYFSRLISFRFTGVLTVEDADNLFSRKSLMIRAAVGMFGALIVYFLLGTELLGATMKPKFDDLSFKLLEVRSVLSLDTFEVMVPSSSWCLLIIWSFLAGFSEKLVPDSLARAEKQLSGAK